MSDMDKVGGVPAAMALPSTEGIARRPHSIRRTSHIDMHPHSSGLALDGAARDLVTGPAGSTVVSIASVTARLDAQARLTTLAFTPASGDGDQLLGRPVAAGFRDAVRAAFPVDVAAGSPLALLLDDLPVAALISGYARLYTGEVRAEAARTSMKSDVCSGWRSTGTMMRSVSASLGVPVTIGPPAPTMTVEYDTDPIGWHDVGELPNGSMRRRRLIDITDAGDEWSINAMFRDTHVQGDGHETVLHEYTLTATIDPETRRYRSCAAIPRVLPWVECPVAAASAEQLVGLRTAEVRDHVRREMRGTTTCTHLNDLLRSLGDVDALVRSLHACETAGHPATSG